ncbi:Deoxyguanosinetriphosphate triphosphohydrolase-like protein [bioreactor metagenome]|uniref:Deoxyguanosinetriphosphate triphosphohydrolase-like protein n=1 Tax=bioreactor metagenome TaxID=1076179 RepID=A0A644Z1W6_9ZZZZ
METMGLAQRVVRELFAIYFDQVQEMPAAQAADAQQGDVMKRARVVADFIAGMTDRYAGREHERLTGSRLLTA